MSICLLLLILLPLLGAAAVAAASARLARGLALGIALLTACTAAVLVMNFDFHPGAARGRRVDQLANSFQFEFPAHIVRVMPGDDEDDATAAAPAPVMLSQFGVSDLGFQFHLGMDSIALWLVLLSVTVTPLALLGSFDAIRSRQREFYAWMLVLLAALNGAFLSRDLLLFYIFFELTLVPTYFLIGIWGGPLRRQAAGKFFLYTFVGSVFMLAGLIFLGFKCGSFDLVFILERAQIVLRPGERKLVLISLLAGLAVKVPLAPLHTWQNAAYTEAPAAGSALFAGVLAKLGTYGLLRFVLPVGLVSALGVQNAGLIRFLGVLCIIGILYGALIAWVQHDMQRLIAYSSLSHLGFCVLGLLALNAEGVSGGLLYMVNHGLSIAALFLCVGMIDRRFGTREMDELSGLAKRLPILSFFFVLFVFSNIGLPGLNGFVSEFLTVLGAFTSRNLGVGFGVCAALGVILGALYMLRMTAIVIFGPLKFPIQAALGADDFAPDAEPAERGPLPPLRDLSPREIGLLTPLAVAVVLLGVLPNAVLTSIAPSIDLIRTPLRLAPGLQSQQPVPEQARDDKPAQPAAIAAEALSRKTQSTL